MEVVEDIFGTIPGKIITVIYIIENTIILAVNTSNFAGRMVTYVYPNVNIMFFYVVMLFMIASILRKGGIVVLARMSEILCIIIVFLFMLIFFMGIGNIKISRLTPISSLDILPVLQSNIALLGILAHFPNLFLLSNYINDKEKINQYCIPVAFQQVFLITILLISSIGMLGASIVEISDYPYLSAVKTISLFKVLEKIDVLVISSWILSDFVMVSLLLLTVLNLFKSLFKLSDTKPLIGIFTVITLFLALMLSWNTFEIIPLSQIVIVPVYIFMGYVMPFLVFVVGKIRKKI